MAVATSTFASPLQAPRCSGTGRYISRETALSAWRATSAAGTPAPPASACSARPLSDPRKRWNWSLCSRNGDPSSRVFTYARNSGARSARARARASCSGGRTAAGRAVAAGERAPPGAVAGGRSVQASVPASDAAAAKRNVWCNMVTPCRGSAGGPEGPGRRAQHEESSAKNRRLKRASGSGNPRGDSPPRRCRYSFPVPMLPLLILLVARDTVGYWQQQVAYRIIASLDEPSGVLTGWERITYVNRSPATLRDFFVHQYLNAFRPGSRWAAADSAEQRDRFQHLQDPDFAFERITAATLMGEALRPDYPYAPDSTVAHWTLPHPLAPGDSLVAEIAWRARPSTVARRQGRQGRRFDFAQWYPKVVVYDKYGWEDHPLYPAGEFYGEFASYDVTLDLAADQVIGATGVPVEGDPGWEKANANPRIPVEYQRNYYDARRTPHACTAGQGRKCVRFYADSVHHFAFSLNPEYRYEAGRYKDVVVRVLYLPEDSATWGKGIAVRRTEAALGWLDSLYGKFAWPQITNVHRIEGGGTEFPMMIMDGSAGLGLIVHELGHNYTMGILANNEWREGFLDEGFTSFQTGWFFEAHGQGSEYAGLERDILDWDLDRWSEPVSMISERYRDFITYNTMIYQKGQLFYEQLRYVVGGDAVMRQILRTYYARYRLKHVDEAAFRSVAEEVSHRDLRWLFGQWLHGTPLIDYRLDKVQRRRLADGRWLTAVNISRQGDGWMPVEIGDKD